MFDEHDHTQPSDHADANHAGHPTDADSEARPQDQHASTPADESLSLLDRMEQELRTLRSLAAERAALSLELDTRREELERRESELQEIQQRTTQRESELEQAQQQLVEQRDRITAEKQEAEQKIGEIERRAAEIGEHEQSIQSQRAELEQRVAELERQRDAIDLRAAEIEARECSLSSEHEEVARLRAEVDGLREELSRTRAKLAEAGRHLAEQKAQPAPAGPGADDFNQSRRARLARYKQLLRERADKVGQVKEALKRRQKELQSAQGQLVEKQREIAKARDTREQAERLMLEAQEQRSDAARIKRNAELRAAKGKASTFIAGVLVSLVVAVAASWIAVDRTVPATYLATTRLALDTRDADPTPEQIESWNQFITGLPADPQFLERASQRLRVRGFEELGSPTDLRRALEQRLETTSANPDEVTMMLRGAGSGRTQRTLETLATAIVAYANDTRQLRADQSSTRLAARAAAEGEPIEDPRLAIFGIAAGAAAGLVLVLTVLAWRALRATVKRAASQAEAPPQSLPMDETGVVTQV